MKNQKTLTFGKLFDKTLFQSKLELKYFDLDTLRKLLESMILIRKAEQRLAQEREKGNIGGPVHLGVGQEAIAVGISENLTKSDRVFGAHRSHSHLLALGSSLEGFFAEVLGRAIGLSKGMGGSMHLWDQSNGFYGSVPIVAGTVPLAVGAGLAAKMQGTHDIAVSYFGDGATEEGVVHESLNLARMLNAQVLFVAENNLFASHMHISLRQPHDACARFAHSNDIPFEIVDGNDVISVLQAAKRLIDQTREGKGPGFLEAVTYRWYGHVDWREDIDVGVNRSKEDLRTWKKRDPIRRFCDAFLDSNQITQNEIRAIEERIDSVIESSWNDALKASPPTEKDLFDKIYAAN